MQSPVVRTWFFITLSALNLQGHDPEDSKYEQEYQTSSLQESEAWMIDLGGSYAFEGDLQGLQDSRARSISR